MINRTLIIAEVKTKSPFGFESSKSWEELFELANRAGDWISVHTDLRWGGSFELIEKARLLTSKPILAKDIHTNDSDIMRAVERGADYVLVVGRIPEVHRDRCIIEPLNLAELSQIPINFKIVWNSRDLSNGQLKKETFEQARKIWKGWICQASNITTINDVKEGADAVLVGTNLEEFYNSMLEKD